MLRAAAKESNTMEADAEHVTPVEAVKDVSSAEAIGESGVKLKAAENDAMLEDAAEGGAELETTAEEAITTKTGQAVTDAQGGGDLSAESCPNLAQVEEVAKVRKDKIPNVE